MKKILGTLSLVILTAACTTKSNTGSASSQPKPTTAPGPALPDMVKTDPDAVPKVNELLSKVAGKKLNLIEENERTTQDGAVVGTPYTRSADEIAKADNCIKTDESGNSVKEPCDNILAITPVDKQYVTVQTQTSPSKSMVSQYTLNEKGELQVSLIDVTADSIFYKEGGKVVIDGDKFILRMENKCYGSDAKVIEGCLSIDDRVFQIPN